MKPYYQDDHCTIYHGDCRDVLPELQKVDLVLTDPPYGIGESKGKNESRSKLATAKDYGVSDWDEKPIDWELMKTVISKGTYSIIFGGNYYPVPPNAKWLVWDKNNSGDFADCELAWSNLNGAVRKFKYTWNGMIQENMKEKEFRQHPTQKPVPLMRWCIEQAGNPQTILDPFMGSGTTLRASKDLNRKCIGIELEERYCQIAVKRLQQEVMQF